MFSPSYLVPCYACITRFPRDGVHSSPSAVPEDEHKHIQGLQCAPCLCKSHVWSAALDVWSSEDPYINEFLQCYLGLTSTKD